MPMELDRCLKIVSGVVVGSIVGLPPAAGQVVPDGSLSTAVDLSGSQINVREGSAVGPNLFHSFQDFSVPANSEVLFEHGTNIDRIISRVTGNNISAIDGLLRTTGAVDFILLNPNGISFGPNAQLPVGGSFLATSAESVVFADGTVFDAQDSTGSSLTVSVPVGLQLGQQPGTIRVQGPGSQLSLVDPDNPIFSPTQRSPSQTGLAFATGGTIAGLAVAPGETIGLLGGAISLEGGVLLAEGGRIELGAATDSLVGLDPNTFALDHSNVSGFGPIELTQASLVDASGFPSGDIQVQGQQLALLDGSTLLVQHLGSGAGAGGTGILGSIEVGTSDSIIVQGSNPNINMSFIRSSITSEALTGTSGDINVTTQQLAVTDGGTIVTRNFSDIGSGGDVHITADVIEVSGLSLIPGVPSTLGTVTFAQAISDEAISDEAGFAGNTFIDTRTLSVNEGGSIVASTFGLGNGGALEISATESIVVNGGAVTDPQLPSILSVTTLGSGNAGDLTIETAQLNVIEGGRVDSSTIASGDAGSLTINATDSVLVDGTIPGSGAPSPANASFISASALQADAATLEALGLPAVPSGGSGNLTITTPSLIVSDAGFVSAANAGIGLGGGELQIDATSVLLETGGTLATSTLQGVGGNIVLDNAQTIVLRDNSNISADNFGGDGGNISLDAESLTLLESATIQANALQGQGGVITIETASLLALPGQITASSEIGLEGTVAVTTPGAAVIQKGIDLPQEGVIVAEQIVARACQSSSGEVASEFIVIGRGGLPAQPNAPLSQEALVRFDAAEVAIASQATSPPLPRDRDFAAERLAAAQLPPPATGWYVNSEGRVVLSPLVSTPTATVAAAPLPNCSE